jgi:mRNA-degrading endonuclease YafQ of YafQ-DinJ toxin-antitoxin module
VFTILPNLKSLGKLPGFVKKAFLEKEGTFLTDPFHTSLETHKLHGKYKDYLAFTVIGQYRVMFTFLNDREVGFINIGTHNIYR